MYDHVDGMIAAPLAKRNAELEVANQKLREKAQALLDALREGKDSIDGAFVFAAIHGQNYEWRGYGNEAAALQKVIADTQAGKEGS
jgi:hypothetical protein